MNMGPDLDNTFFELHLFPTSFLFS